MSVRVVREKEHEKDYECKEAENEKRIGIT